MAEPKLVVTEAKGGSKITLIGASGTPLLTSKVFTEPRGKGATLRALKGLLGEGIAVDDQTAPATVTTSRAAPTVRARKPARGTAKTRKRAVAVRGASKTTRSANASRSRRRAVKRSARA